MKRWTYPEGELWLGDCLKVLPKLGEDSVDLVFGSPPYEQARLYLEDGVDLNIARDTEDWVAWMLEVVKQCLRVCKGLVALVVGHGQTRDRTWSGAPALLCADLIRSGVVLRRPCIYRRHGIMGSGGNDWLKASYEWIVCATKSNKELPWSDNTAMGHPPRCSPGGRPSHRARDGTRASATDQKKIAQLMQERNISKKKAGELLGIGRLRALNSNGCNKREGVEGGARISRGIYVPPQRANPGDVITCKAGGGHMGSDIAHDQEASFPEKLAEFFVRSFCKPGGVVLDPFLGSATTASVAIKTSRKFIAVDLRPSQMALAKRRIVQARALRGFGT